jgi:uncharacterized protein involved in exopolysaccharide biosynthesis
MGVNGNDAGPKQISAREILTVIFRRKVPILIVTVSVAAAVLTAAARTSSVFQGTSKILLRRTGVNPLVTTWTPFYGLEEEMNTEVEIITSAAVMDRSVEILKQKGAHVTYAHGDSTIRREPTIEDVASGVSATPVEMSNVILIRFTGSDPEFVEQAANAVSEAYIEHRVPLRSSSDINSYFSEQIAVVEAQLLDLISTELQLRKQGEIYDLEWQYHMALGRRSELRLQLAEVRSERLAEEEKLRSARRRWHEDPDVLVPFAEFHRDKLGGQMLAEYWSLRKQRDEKAAYLTDNNPQVRMLDDQITRMEARFKEEIERRIKDKEFKLEDLRAEERGYISTIDDISDDLRMTPEVVAQIQHLQKEIHYTYLHYEKLLEKMLDSMASEVDDIRLANAKVISPASVQRTTVGRMQTVYVAFSILLGISLGIGFGFLLESMDHSVRSASDIEDELGIPLLGSVPDSRGLPRITRRVDRTFKHNS